MTPGPDHPAPSHPPRHRGLLGALAAFMEARNIFWGELVGGLLFVGCSIALVISLWDALADNPLFKFCTFIGADAAVFGAGLYTLRRWKLESTSRGLLLIALLLAPLAMLAMMVPYGVGGRLELPSQIAALLVLAFLVERAGRVFVPDGAVLLCAAVVGTSACQLLVVRLVDATASETRFLLAGLAATACHGLPLGAYLVGVGRRGLKTPQQAAAVFLFQAAATFALAVALGLLAQRRQDLPAALGLASVLLALAGVPLLAGGLLVHRGLEDDPRAAPQRTAGTAVALAGMVVMLLALGVAWPRPPLVLAVCALNFAALTAVAFRARLPLAHAVALACLAVGYLVGYYLVGGRLAVDTGQLGGRMVELLSSAETGVALAALFLLFGLAAEAIARLGHPGHGKWYAVGAVAIALLSLALVAPHAAGEAVRPAALCALYGAGILAGNLRWRRQEATYLGLALLGGATVAGLWHVYGRVVPEWGTVLAAWALAATVVAGVLRRVQLAAASGTYAVPLTVAGHVAGWAALGVTGWCAWSEWTLRGGFSWPAADALTAACLAALWTVAAVTGRQEGAARLSAWLTLAAFVAAAGWLLQRAGVADLSGPLALGISLAALGMMAAALVGLRRGSAWSGVLASAWRETSALALLLTLGLALPSVTWHWHWLTAGLLAATAFLLAGSLRAPLASWIGSALVLGGVAHALAFGPGSRHLAQPWSVALLVHSTLALLAGLLLRLRPARRADERQALVEKVFVAPLLQSALASSFLALPFLLDAASRSLTIAAVETLWLAGVWLAVSSLNRWAGLFAGFQAALAAAVVLGLAAVRAGRVEFADLQVYGIGLAGLSLLWTLVRRSLHAWPGARALLEPPWPALDRVVLAALLPAQLLLAALAIAPGAVAELSPLPPEGGPVAVVGVGVEAWALLGVLALTLLVAAREGVNPFTVLGVLPMALAVPVLLARQFGEERAVASALRWGLAACFMLCSVPLWLRSQLGGLLRRRGVRIESGLHVSAAVRWLLIAAAAAPVLLLTLAPTMAHYLGLPAEAGPMDGSFFRQIRPVVSIAFPLVLVCLGLVGHALREQSPGYAFVVGLGGMIGVSLIVRYYHRREDLLNWWVYLAQANAIAVGVVALLWLAARRHLYGEGRSGVLLGFQVALAPACNAALLVFLALLLVAAPGESPLNVGQGGGGWGWVALALAAAVAVWHQRERGWREAGQVACALATAVAVLAACTAARWGDGWLAYHALTAALAVAAALILGCGWLSARRATAGNKALVPAELASAWVGALGGLVVFLALRGLGQDPASPWWPAGAVLAASALAAATALWQRREGWAFAAALGVNLAASVVLWHHHADRPLTDWWVVLVQANVIAGAGAALLWLPGRRLLHGETGRAGQPAPFLDALVGLTLLGNVILLLGPALRLVGEPGTADANVVQAGQPWAWLALLAALGAAAWHAHQSLARAAIHVAGGTGVALAVLAGCTAAALAGQGSWLPYHVLTVGCAVAGAAILAARVRVEGPRVAWVAAFGGLLVALGLRGVGADPTGPWWSAATVLEAGALAVGLALWRRQKSWAFAAALAVNLAVSLVLWHFHRNQGLEQWWVPLAQANVLAAATAALAWQAACRRLHGENRPGLTRAPLLHVQLVLAVLGNAVLLLGPGAELIARPDADHLSVLQAGTPWAWLALVVTLVAVARHVGDRLGRFGVHLLCGLGLAAGVLAACTLAAWQGVSGWATYHTLTAVWALTGAAALSVGWRRAQHPPDSESCGGNAARSARLRVLPLDAVGTWAAGCALLVLGLALRGLVGGDADAPWWPAAAVLAAGALAAALAWRHRREGWAFAAGLSVNLAVSLVLWHAHRAVDLRDWWVPLVQANVLASAGLALVWLWLSRALYGGALPGPATAPLLAVQVGLGLAGNAALLIGPAAALIASPGAVSASVQDAGTPWGWLALLVTLAAAGWYAGRTLAREGVHMLCGLGLALGVLVACATSFVPVDRLWVGYHALMAAWALTGLVTVAVGGVYAHRREAGEGGRAIAVSGGVVRAWVAALSLLVVGLALRGATEDPTGKGWSAGAVLAVSAVLAVTAWRRRRENWAFAAGLAFNLAVSLLVWEWHGEAPVAAWWVPLLQANVIASAAVALVWLTFQRRRPEDRGGLTATPLLSLQTALGLVGNFVLLATATGWLIARPDSVHAWVVEVGEVGGWGALLSAGLAMAWHLRDATGRVSWHLRVALALAAVVLAACTAAAWQGDGWLAYRVLAGGLVLTCAALLAIGWGLSRSDAALRGWLTAVGLLVAGLALRGVGQDPASPWWPAGLILALAVLAAARAVWQRSEAWAFAAGLVLNLAVSLVLWEWQHAGTLESWWLRFILANLAAGGFAALLWLAAWRRLYDTTRRATLLPVQLGVVALGNALLLGTAAAVLVLQPQPVHDAVRQVGGVWGWFALLPALVAAAWYWRRVVFVAGVDLLAAVALALGVLAACSVAPHDRGDWLAYHVMTAAWVAAGALVLVAGAKGARRAADTDSASAVGDAACTWVGILAVLAVGLAVRGAALDPVGPWWSAAAALAAGVLAGGVALWQRREGWAFAAGLALNLAVSLVLWHEYFTMHLGRWWVLLVQVNVLANSVAALAWLAAYRRLYAEGRTSRLLSLQVLLGLVGNAAVLAAPLVWLVLRPDALPRAVGEAGEPLGWLALLSAAAVAVWYFRKAAATVGVHAVCSLALAVGVLAACTATRWQHVDWLEYHVLTFAWAAAGFGVLFVAWRLARGRRDFPLRAVQTWLAAVGLLVLGLALRAVGEDPLEPWCSVAAVLAVSALFGGVALWRQHEGWAFASGAAINLAVTLLVAHFQRAAGWAEWWTWLLQVNIVASAATTMVWLSVRRQRRADRAEEIGASPLLSVKIAVELTANALLLVGPLALLVLDPGGSHELVREAGDFWGWLALLLSLVSAAWCFRDVAGRFGVYVIGGLGLTLGVLAACTASRLPEASWLPYHVLTCVWALTAVITVAVAWKGSVLRRRAGGGPPETVAPLFPVAVVRTWVLAVCTLVVGLALRGVQEDPDGPWWSAGAILGASAAGGLLAAWQRRPGWAWAAGLGVNLALSLVLWRWHHAESLALWWVPLLQANILAAAATALVWLAGRQRLGITAAAPLLVAQVALTLLGNVALLVGPAVSLIAQPAPVEDQVKQAGEVWGWLALLASLTAALWHLRQTVARGGLHVLCGLGLALGVLAACTAGRLWDRSDLLAYHVLTAGWWLVGAAALVGGVLSTRRAPGTEAPDRGKLFDAGLVRAWVAAVCVLVIGLVLREIGANPSDIRWPAGAVLAVSVLAGAMALWQRSDAWTFAAGLGINLAVSLLLWEARPPVLDERWWIQAVQVNAAISSLAALLWLAARHWGGGAAVEPPGALLTIQIGLGAAANVCLLLSGLGGVIEAPQGWTVSAGHPRSAVWTLGAGSALGWLAWALTAAAVEMWARQRRLTTTLNDIGLLGLVVLGLTACSVEVLAPGWGYRALMLGAAAFALVFAGLSWRSAAGESRATARVSVVWVAPFVTAIVLAVKAAEWHQDRVWAAAVLGVAAFAAGVTALWQRREGWAFLAGLGVNAAVSLLVQHGFEGTGRDWWIVLVQANVITGAAVAFAWLAAARRLYGELRQIAPLLSVQILLVLAGNGVLLVGPAVLLIERPSPVHAHALEAGTLWGWLAFLLAAVAAVWHVGQTLARGAVHVLCTLGLGLGVLLACTAGHADPHGWLAYHTLTAAWALTGAAALIGGVLANWRPQRIDVPPSNFPAAEAPAPVAPVLPWVAALAVVLVALAPHRVAENDPLAPWWPAGMILAAGALAAGAAAWRRREGWVFAAALSLNFAVSFVLWHFHKGEPQSSWWVPLVQANAIAAAAAALLWLASARHLYGVPRPGVFGAPLLTAQVVLALAANALLLGIPALLLVGRPDEVRPLVLQAGQVWGWLALLLAGVTARWHLRRTDNPIRRTHVLCAGGLAVAVLAACTAARWESPWLAYHVLTAVCVLAGFAALAAGWFAERLASRAAAEPFLSVALVRAWGAGICALAMGLALRGVGQDPAGNLWAAGTAAAVSILAALMALWQRRETWAFAAALALQFAVSLAVWHVHAREDFWLWWVPLVQANVLAGAAGALLWLAAGKRVYGGSPGAAPLLGVQVLLGLVGNAALLLGPAARLIVDPGNPDLSVTQAGSFWGWLSLLAPLAAVVWYVGGRQVRGGVHLLCALGLGVGVLAACTAARIHPGDWLAYHTLMAAWALLAVGGLAIGWQAELRSRSTGDADRSPAGPVELRGWVTALGIFVVGLALRGLGQDTTGPLWSAGTVLVVGALAGALALWSRRQVHVYASGLLVCLAGTACFNGRGTALDLLTVNVLCVALASAVWAGIEQALRSRVPPRDLRGGWLPFTHAGAVAAVCTVAALAGLGVTSDLIGTGLRVTGLLPWAALAAAGVALAVCLCEPGVRFPLPGLYLLGLSAVGLLLHTWHPMLHWAAAPLLAGYVLLTAGVWLVARPREGVEPAGDAAPDWGRLWFAPAQAVFACAAVTLSLWTCLGAPTAAQRQMGTLAVGLLLAAALLAARAEGRWRLAVRYGALALGALLAVEAGWGALDSGLHAPWLYRSGLLLAVFSLLTVAYTVVLPRLLARRPGWAQCARHAGSTAGLFALVALAAVLVQEVAAFVGGTVASPGGLFTATVAVAVAVMLATALALAVVRGLDPFGLSERGRTAYVYAAELLLVLFFVHLRLAAPELFGGRLVRYWPFLTLGIAFAGAAAGELFRRLGLRVLAEPLQHTGVFLPVLPIVAFWVQPLGEYAMLWFLAGALYVLLSVTRRSLGFLLLAALAANVGLWLVLQKNQLAFIQYPQLWLIPFALSVLGAEHLNRGRLTRNQRNAIRYSALTAIYISSTAETLLTGLGQDAVRPLVLVALSVLGVFAGMLLRVRAFLFLGSGFLLMGLFAVIRHAAHVAEERGRIVWLVAGAVVGALIFALFAFFEKRRNDVIRLLQKLKDWE